jgi:glutamate/tyrosine decarboxylase-like PLP-dependent enzyme
MENPDLEFLHPYYMGAYAENDHIFEKIMLEFFRDHAYWRRNFHPESRPPIPTNAPYREDFNEFLARMQQELHTLSADLKKSVPFFSPRYMGHMAADLLLPGVLAQMMTVLYNPNNVSDDAAPATLEKEVEVGFQLAKMFGFNTDESEQPVAWGHLTSGGTVANYEGLWNLRAVKFYPVSLAEGLKKHSFEIEDVGPKTQKLSEYSKWELFNFTVRETVLLMRKAMREIRKQSSRSEYQDIVKNIVAESIESVGFAQFFLNHPELKPPRVIVPTTAHYSWEKAMKVLGIGTNNLVSIPTDGHMRMCSDKLQEVVDQYIRDEQPVLAVVGVLGSTEFGSVDPIHKIVQIRKKALGQGFFFGFHIDAAWGGYMASIFRNSDGSFVDHEEIKQEFKYFPHKGTWKAFGQTCEADSITIDPHKLGYLPFPCGAFVSRDAGVLDFISQKAAYVFDLKDDPANKPPSKRLLGLGQYIMEGSKPGSAAAAAYITHRCIPLHKEGFGKILIHSMKACEYFFDKIEDVNKRLRGLATITIPFAPDTNLICYAINPTGNANLALMNVFSRRVFKNIRIDPKQPLQAHHFFGSFTSLSKDKLDPVQAKRILEELGIDENTFVSNVDDQTREADHIYLIRHTLMNPWLLFKDKDLNYIDRYCLYLCKVIKDEMEKAVRSGP